MNLPLDLIIEIVAYIVLILTMVVACVVNIYILKALKSISQAFGALYGTVESIDTKLEEIKKLK